MKIIKIYETILNLSATEMYSNIDATVLDKLKKIFEGKCEKNTLIINILGINKRSQCKMTKNRLDGSGDVNVQFKAEAIMYSENDILTGCEIQNIERGSKIICKHEHAIVNIKNIRNLQSLKPGNKLVVKILGVSYPKGKEKITIQGTPYTYSYKFTIYLTDFSVDITDEQIVLIKNKLKEIDSEYELYKNSDTKLVDYFNNIFYPFKTNYDKYKKSFNNKKVDIINIYNMAQDLVNNKLKEKKTLALFKHTLIDKSVPDVFSVLDTDLASGISGDLLNTELYEINIIKEDIILVLLTFLNDYLLHIKCIKEMTEVYDSEKEIENHVNLWTVYNRLKK